MTDDRKASMARTHALVNPAATQRHSMNRPGMSGDSPSWEGWSHVSEFVQEVSAGAA